ncbi:MAG: hypothetical protein C0434_14515 [Xanthomonadaceae bacterium]|nr:hypothetical protein [Xanthomonadaceae bacterium]
MIYYMPKQDIVVTYIRSDGTTAATLTAVAGPAYADMTKRYVLNVDGVLTANRATDVKVSKAGLLESSSAKLESKVGEIAVEIAKAASSVRRQIENKPPEACQGFKEYTMAIDPSALDGKGSKSFCGFTVTIDNGKDTTQTDSIGDVTPKSDAGYYYRQGRPYRVMVCPEPADKKECGGQNNILDAVVSSPTAAPVQFIPVTKALFADNDSLIVFSDGTLQQYKEVKNSELLGFASIPADIVGAYFEAAGKLFGFLNTKNTNEAELLDSKLKLDLVKMRYDACLVAINNKDDPAIESLGCKGD